MQKSLGFGRRMRKDRCVAGDIQLDKASRLGRPQNLRVMAIHAPHKGSGGGKKGLSWDVAFVVGDFAKVPCKNYGVVCP